MVFTVCMVLYDLTLRLVLAAMDGVVAPALCGRPRRNSTGCSTSHKFGRTFVIALVFEQNSGHSPILPWRHDLMDTKNFPGSWSAASNPNSIHSNPFQWVEAISAPSRWHSFALVASARISQHVTSVSVTQWYSVSSVQEICSLPGRWSILKNNSMGLKELKKEWSVVARHNLNI